MLTRMVVRPALAGRARELAELEARLAAARAGDGGLLLVTGPPGIGKSALVQAAAARAADEGLPVLTGRATDDAAPPLWLWAPVLTGLGLPAGLVSAPVAGTGEDAQVARFTALQSLAGDLLGALPRAGALVVLEDLHWADATSTALLRALAPRLASSPVLVLATHRPVRAGSTARRSALAAELPWVQAEPAVASVRLGPLDRAAVESLLGTLLGSEAAAALAEPVLGTTRGNALFVRTVGRLLADVPAAERPERLASLRTSPELSDVVRSWTRGLPTACLDLLRVAGLAGRAVDVDAVAAVRGLAHDEVLELLDAALAAGVLERRASGALAFVHDVVRDVLSADLPAAEQAACSRALAGHLELAGAAPADVARHWLRGARSEQERRSAVTWARRAAGVASAGLDWTSAQDLLSQALLAAPGAPARERAELHLELAEVRYRAGDVTAALLACRQAADLAAGVPTGPTRAGLLAAAAVVVQGMGAPEVNTVLLDLTERALLAGPDEAELARVLAQRACALVQLDRTREAAPLSQQALDLARRVGLPQAELDAVRARHLAVGEPARHVERTALAERALELATELHQPVARLWALLWLVDSAFVAGDLGGVDARLLDLEVLVPSLGLPLAHWHLHRLHAARSALVGDFGAARLAAGRAVSTAAAMCAGDLVGVAYAFFVELAALRGSADDLPHDLEERLETAPSMPIVTASRGLVDLLHGRRDAAAGRYAQVLAGLDALPVNGRWLGTVVQTADLAVALDDPVGAERLHALLRPSADLCAAGPTGTVFSRGSTHLLLGRLALVAGRVQDALDHLDRADAANTRGGARPFLVLADVSRAGALLARRAPGDAAQAVSCARRAGALAAVLGMPGPQSDADRLLAGTAPDGGLSAREDEVVALVADGLTNRQIAERFVLSERTVESHVRNALLKLGLSRRAELVAWRLSTARR
jgi:DNA-binding CsgD family transcriptional regulator/tetratricopeptide (TPR) repeat protein